MRSILFLLFALVLCNSLSTEIQCDSTNREYEAVRGRIEQTCLVLNECVIGDTRPHEYIVEFNSRTQQLKDGKCDVFIQLRSLNQQHWFINITTDVKIRAYYLQQDRENIVTYGSAKASSDIFTAIEEGCSNDDVHRICNFTIVTPPESTDPDVATYLINRATMNLLFTYKYPSDGTTYRRDTIRSFDGKPAEFYGKVVVTRGCDFSLINVQSSIVQEGISLDVPTRLVGRNAAIDCKKKRADRLYIKRSTDADFVEVTKVFCPETVWVVENSDGKIEYLGEKTFDLKCIRNFCKYCGRIDEQPCDSCEDIEYEDCMPKCPRNLWVRSGTIINSTIKCEANEKSKGDFGEWTLRSNGVDVPFLAGSCYTGPYPLHEKHKAISNLSPSFSHRVILLVVLAAFNWIGIC